LGTTHWKEALLYGQYIPGGKIVTTDINGRRNAKNHSRGVVPRRRTSCNRMGLVLIENNASMFDSDSTLRRRYHQRTCVKAVDAEAASAVENARAKAMDKAAFQLWGIVSSMNFSSK
jgi:deoxycytidylate deaminase